MAYIPRFPDIHFDYGAIKELAPELAARGVDRPLIITDQGLVEHGVLLVAHWLTLSLFPHWWGGHYYGPRLFADALPWLLALSALATAAWRRATLCHPQGRGRWRLEQAVAALLVLLAVVINGAGALSEETRYWNDRPVNVDDRPERVWDWSDPQFLAWLTPSLPAERRPAR